MVKAFTKTINRKTAIPLMLEVRVTVYNLQLANEKKNKWLRKKERKTASSEENILMFSENMHKDIKEGHKKVLDQLKLQHEQRMKTEDAKIMVMTKLMDRLTEKK